MKLCCQLICLLALAVMDVSCRKPDQPQTGSDDAKLRPEVAVASQGASPTPGVQDAVRSSPH
ncbi:MAG TPA: hypothetical protein VM940_16590 [Chthoniobacterales bacterium]|nr:hypothetical protein [Chthoniobacterales bacterium]